MDGVVRLLERLARWLYRAPAPLGAPRPEPAPLGAEPAPRRARGGCPVDGARLRPLPELDVARCPDCAGHFVGYRHPVEDPVLAPLDEAARRPLGQRPYLRCPVCGEQMARWNFHRVSGILVDRCPSHGVWYDPGEIRAAQAFLAEGGAERRRAFEAGEARWHAEQRALAQRWGRQGGNNARSDAAFVEWFVDG